MDSKTLFEDFCHYRDHTAYYQKHKQFHKMKSLTFNEKHQALFDEMIEWCNQRNINPRHWLYSLFATRRWVFAPRLERGVLCSENHVLKFRRFRDYDFYKQYRERDRQQRRYDPNRDLSAASEQAKATYLARDQARLCMSQMTYETFGYHPKSSICARCSLAQQCQETLQSRVEFDIMALRNGAITAEEAYQQAKQRQPAYVR